MVEEKTMRKLPRCAHCGGVAMLRYSRRSGNYWLDCENLWAKGGTHTCTVFYETEEAACAAWRRNVDFDNGRKNNA